MAATYAPMPQSSFGQPPWDQDEYRTLNSQRSRDYLPNDRNSAGRSSNQESLSSRSGGKRSAVTDPGRPAEDRSPWIHRDKLAQIESREMAEFGIPVPRSSRQNADESRSRSASRASNKGARSRDRHSNRNGYERDSDVQSPTDYEGDHQFAIPPVPGSFEASDRDMMVDKEEHPGDEVERTRSQQERRQRSRPPTSRIPISRNSPAPVSHSVIERESPLPRSRNSSGAWDTSPELGGKPRSRSQSLEAGYALENTAIPRPRTPNSRPASAHLSSSPKQYLTPSPSAAMKARTPDGLLAGKKTGTTPLSGHKPRTPSSVSARTSLDARPRTSSGKAPNPINRPEGDAPWLATMYKPDPMLPPDQQILPTHAKRLQQEEQQPRPSQSSTGYDAAPNNTDLSHVKPGPPPPIPHQSSLRQNTAQNTTTTASPETFPGAWTGPAPSTANHPDPQFQFASPTRNLSNAAPTSRSNSTAGGYRITPSISASPALPQNAGYAAVQAQQMANLEKAQQREAMAGGGVRQGSATGYQASVWREGQAGRPGVGAGEKKEKKKGLGCCVVM